MKKVIIIAYYFPPVSASGALRPLGFTRYLGIHGWEPIVISAKPDSIYPSMAIDADQNKFLPPELRVLWVADRNPIKLLLEQRIKLVHGSKAPTATNGTTAQSNAVKSKSWLKRRLDYLQEQFFEFPDHQKFWLKPAVKRATQVLTTEKIDAIFVTAGPWTSLRIGKALTLKHDVPLIVDFRDPWTDNPYKEFRGRLAAKASEVEKDVCGMAARVIANTIELEQMFRTKYSEFGDKLTTITNGFDTFASDTSEKRMNSNSDPKAKIELHHFGTIYNKRSPLELLKAVHELWLQESVKSGDLLIRFVGTWHLDDMQCEKLTRELESAGLVRREPAISYQACLQRMNASKALLVIQPESPLQIPAKIYEYIATCRPLLIVGGEGATANLVRNYKLGTCWPNKKVAIKNLILSLVEDKTTLTAPNQRNIKKFHYSHLTAQLADVLDSVVAARKLPTSTLV